MPRTGRPRKPSALKLLQGTYRADRAAPNEPTPDVQVPTCPTWLHAEAKREWRRVVPELEALGLVSLIDRAALAAYCQSYATWWTTERDIAENGATQRSDRSGLESARPQVAIRDQALRQMRAFLVEFGLTPSARSRVSAVEKATPQDNPFLRIGTS